ncbi:7TM GPCR, serpentine receptor class ab (Srab) family-containing protein [Strongyloides ratti]|uniref:7TM GPCR, serpentine receptor class ab (Srab) family-containing protein n=1 Tax=Strongyloides ratti TaxID=34506 RepID=A0A090L5Q2_STRRB|nr:7TM GPCR, serpentine receptor class ab (Srab) family-containing protein [Strongyloides ratti]CEF63447.1 7TM GPCR, serpentine receptor class ab (Srab) family-containing protein [Strongyloides ratti]
MFSLINNGILRFAYDDDDKIKTSYYIIRYIQNYSNNLIRFSIWFLIIERILATKKRKTYEKNKNILVIIALLTLDFSFAGIFTNLRNIISIINQNFHQFLFVIDVPLIISLIILRYINRSIRRHENSVILNLTEKYQIIENVKSISKIIHTVCAFVLLSTVDLCIFSIVAEDSMNYQLKTLINFLVKSIVYSIITMHLIYTTYKSDNKKNYVNIFFERFFCKQKRNKIFVSGDKLQQVNTHSVKNIDGLELVQTGTQENYFAYFEKVWK